MKKTKISKRAQYKIDKETKKENEVKIKEIATRVSEGEYVGIEDIRFLNEIVSEQIEIAGRNNEYYVSRGKKVNKVVIVLSAATLVLTSISIISDLKKILKSEDIDEDNAIPTQPFTDKEDSLIVTTF